MPLPTINYQPPKQETNDDAEFNKLMSTLQKQADRAKEKKVVEKLIGQNSDLFKGFDAENLPKTYTGYQQIYNAIKKTKSDDANNFYADYAKTSEVTQPQEKGKAKNIQNITPSTSPELKLLQAGVRESALSKINKKIEDNKDTPDNITIPEIYAIKGISQTDRDALVEKVTALKDEKKYKEYFTQTIGKQEWLPPNVTTFEEYEEWNKLDDTQKAIQKKEADIEKLVSIDSNEWNIDKLNKLTPTQLSKQVERGKWIEESKDILAEYPKYKPSYAENIDFVDTEVEVKKLRSDLITIKNVAEGIKHINDTIEDYISKEEITSLMNGMEVDPESGKKAVSAKITNKLRQDINNGSKPIATIQDLISSNRGLFEAKDYLSLVNKAEDKQTGIIHMETSQHSILALADTFGLSRTEKEKINEYVEVKKNDNAHLSMNELLFYFGLSKKLDKLDKSEKSIKDELSLYINHFNQHFDKDKEQ